jgi:serine/threonine-protein kinase
MRGVAEAHRQDIVHRDIHPGNIFLSRESHDPRPVPMVLDFGISKFGNVGAEQRALTRSNMCMGTPLYMSYEQLYSARDVDARTDVYSFGVILYEGLTGKPPFDGESLMEVAGKITAGIPVHPKKLRPEIPTALAEIVLWAMARKREDRIPTMEAFIRELEPFATERAFRAQMTDVEQVLPNVPRAERFAEAIPIDDEVESVDTPAAPPPPPLPSGRPSAEPIAPLATLASRPALSKEVDTLGQRTSKLAQSMRPPPPDERRRRTTRLAAAGIALLVGGAAVVWKVSEHGTSQQPPAANVASDPSDSALPAAQLDTPLATAPASGASQALPPQHAADAAGRPDAAAASSTQSAPGANSKDAPASIPVASVASRRASGTAAVSLTPRPPIKSRPAQKATPPLPPRRAGELKIKDLY